MANNLCTRCHVNPSANPGFHCLPCQQLDAIERQTKAIERQNNAVNGGGGPPESAGEVYLLAWVGSWLLFVLWDTWKQMFLIVFEFVKLVLSTINLI